MDKNELKKFIDDQDIMMEQQGKEQKQLLEKIIEKLHDIHD